MMLRDVDPETFRSAGRARERHEEEKDEAHKVRGEETVDFEGESDHRRNSFGT